MTDITVTKEDDHVLIDSHEWVDAWASDDVTDQWQEIIDRAHNGQWFGEHYLPEHTWRAMRGAFARSRRVDDGAYGEWTGNRDSTLDTELIIDAFKLRNDRGWLVFVTYSPVALVDTPDRAIILGTLDDLWSLTDPRVDAQCGCGNEWWTTVDGMNLEKSNGSRARVEDKACPDCGQEFSYWCCVQ